jgi:hypothetical protein
MLQEKRAFGEEKWQCRSIGILESTTCSRLQNVGRVVQLDDPGANKSAPRYTASAPSWQMQLPRSTATKVSAIPSSTCWGAQLLV